MSKSELEQKIDWVANEKWFVDLMRNKPRVVNGKLSAEAKLVNKMELMQAIQASLYPDFLKSFRNDDLPMSLRIPYYLILVDYFPGEIPKDKQKFYPRGHSLGKSDINNDVNRMQFDQFLKSGNYLGDKSKSEVDLNRMQLEQLNLQRQALDIQSKTLKYQQDKDRAKEDANFYQSVLPKNPISITIDKGLSNPESIGGSGVDGRLR